MVPRLSRQSVSRIGKSVLFCGGLLLILLGVDFIMRPTTAGVLPWASLAQTRNEADVLVMGSSRTHCTVMPMEIWRRAGITAVDVTCGGQPIVTTLAYLKQALTGQKPKVVLVEVSLMGMDLPYKDLPGAHNNFDNMPLGLARTEGILRSVNPTAWPEFFLPLHVYHSRWSEITAYDRQLDKRSRFGFAMGALYLPESQPQSQTVTTTRQIDQRNYQRDLRFIGDMAEQCERINAQMVLFTSPSAGRLAVGKQPLLDRLQQDLKREHPAVDYLDMNPVAASIGVDPKTDYKDANHVNFRGAVKLSRWLADHLATEYGVPSRRSDELAQRWNDDLLKYDELFAPKQ